MKKILIAKRWYIFAGLFLVIVAAVFFINANSQKNTEITRPKFGPIHEAVYGLGTVKSNKVYELKLGVTATISKIYVKEGETVKKGDHLIDFEQATRERAPFTGTLTSLPFHEGENVFAQTPILRIEDLKDLYIEVALEQQGALRVHPDQEVRLSFENLRGNTFLGVVRAIFPFQGQFLVHVNVKNIPENVLPGMTSDVAIEVAKKENALLAPVTAISNGKLIRVRNGKKEKIDVKLGTVDGEWAEIIEGDLNSNDSIVVRRN